MRLVNSDYHLFYLLGDKYITGKAPLAIKTNRRIETGWACQNKKG